MARTTIKIMEQGSMAGILTDWLVYTPADIMESQAKLIKSFPIMKKVALRLNLVDDNTPEPVLLNVAAGLQAKINAETIKRTNIIMITTQSGNAKEAMDLANTVAQISVEENLLEKRKQSAAARFFIEEQLARLEKTLKYGEERIRAFGDEEGGVRLAEPIQKKLVELEFELATLLQQYTDKHPYVIQLKGQIRDMEAQLKGFSGQDLVYSRLLREVQVNKNLYGMLKSKLEEARITEARKVGDISIVDPAGLPAIPMGPDKKVGILFGALLGMLLGIIFAFIIDSMDTSIGTIEDMEAITKLPVLGVVPSVMVRPDRKKNIFKEMPVRIFPFRPKQPKGDEAYIRLAVYHDPKSPITEAYRAIRTNLKLGPSLRTILVTSTGPREGKTTVVTNLGLTIAQAGERTLLVSSDLRRPAIAKTFGLKREPGLYEVATKVKPLEEGIRTISDIMLGDMKLDKIMKVPGIENISIFPSGYKPQNPAELLESKEIANLIEELKRRYDVIIFDSPPILPITDAALLAPKVDGVVLVYEAGRTARGALLRAKAQLESAGGKILGLILNHTRPAVAGVSGYPYYYSYKYRYYTDEETGKERRKKIEEAKSPDEKIQDEKSQEDKSDESPV
jgi:tyrosine-protein kinase Etk/Wzc